MASLQNETTGGAIPLGAQTVREPRRVSPVRAALGFIRRKPLGAFGLAMVLLMTVAALGAPWVDRYPPERIFTVQTGTGGGQNVNPGSVTLESLQESKGSRTDQLGSPNWEHWMGTDRGGRDIYSRVVWGARRAMLIGIGAMVSGIIAGSVFGLTSAYFGGTLDLIVQRFMDTLQAFPGLLLLLLLVTLTKPSVLYVTLGLGVLSIAPVQRIVRGTVLSAREEVYVQAARVIGCSDARIMLRHILPNVFAPIIVVFSIGFGAVVLAATGLAFLGLAPIGPDWGAMIDDGRKYMLQSPWTLLFPGVALSLTVLGFNLAGDALRDVLDPRLRV
jgi:peptide/nickel transport system permease protein